MDVETPLLHAVELVNERQKHLIARRILHHFQKPRGGPSRSGAGLQAQDLRRSEATAQTVIRDLVGAGASVRAHDPRAMDEMRGSGELSGVQYFEDQYKTLRGADALALLTEWISTSSLILTVCRSCSRSPWSSTDGTSTPRRHETKGVRLLLRRTPQPPR